MTKRGLCYAYPPNVIRPQGSVAYSFPLSVRPTVLSDDRACSQCEPSKYQGVRWTCADCMFFILGAPNDNA